MREWWDEAASRESRGATEGTASDAGPDVHV